MMLPTTSFSSLFRGCEGTQTAAGLTFFLLGEVRLSLNRKETGREIVEPPLFKTQLKTNYMQNVLSKLAVARLFIKSHPIKKDGRNDYSKYDYFTPEIVSKLVNDACVEANIICVFSLKQDQLGYYGEVVTTDLETGEQLVTETRTAKPMITATNETQQMGGMNTYAKRYSLMSLFDIEDNTIDFDAQDNTKAKAQTPVQDEKPWLNEKDVVFTQAIEKLRAGKTTIDKIASVYKISKTVRAKLEEAINLQTA